MLSKAPSIISIYSTINLDTRVHACGVCGHGQSEDIHYERYYDSEYRFQLSSPEHDELHAVENDVNIFRSDIQARLTLQLVDFPKGGRILDYGAAKATTVRKICRSRPDLAAHVFDVSKDYIEHWNEWLPVERQAPYRIPDAWVGSFDAVSCFFVLEHVPNPNETIAAISSLLVPGGVLVLFVPNPIENYSDFLVIEHVSHFTSSSLKQLLALHDLTVETHATNLFSGAHIVVARKGRVGLRKVKCEASEDFARLQGVAAFWRTAESRIEAAIDRLRGRPCAIYGAGVYGSYVATRLIEKLPPVCFIDRNPYLQGQVRFGVPVALPAQLPVEAEVVFAGLNPLSARTILKDVPEWRGRSVHIEYLDNDN
jgi:2-polyprenyl-3-methyl-5-hydroxy-6-metoxy-1,4-benzoquinol methylase